MKRCSERRRYPSRDQRVSWPPSLAEGHIYQ